MVNGEKRQLHNIQHPLTTITSLLANSTVYKNNNLIIFLRLLIKMLIHEHDTNE